MKKSVVLFKSSIFKFFISCASKLPSSIVVYKMFELPITSNSNAISINPKICATKCTAYLDLIASRNASKNLQEKQGNIKKGFYRLSFEIHRILGIIGSTEFKVFVQ